MEEVKATVEDLKTKLVPHYFAVARSKQGGEWFGASTMMNSRDLVIVKKTAIQDWEGYEIKILTAMLPDI
jgi:hypothetical protein